MKHKPRTIIPPFFVNSIAKSGTHLMKPLLEGVPELKHHRFIFPGHLHQLPEHKQILSTMPNNHFSNGHLYHSQEYVNLFHELDMKQVFLYRDPRDIVVSYAHFFMKFPDHPYYRFFSENKMTLKSRCLLLINGNKILRRPNLNIWYRKFLGWKYEENILPIKYEDLVTSPHSQKMELKKVFAFIGFERINAHRMENVLRKIQNNVDSSKSLTYRKGQAGDWKQEFDKDLKTQFKKVAGELLIELGYEKDMNW